MVILETERLILRTFRPDDLPPLCRFYSDPEVRRFFPEGVLTAEQTREELEWHLNGGWREHPDLGLWATVERQSHELIGRCGLIPWTIEGRTEIEIAYLIARTHWRMGFAAEAVEAIVRHAFGVLRLSRLVALIDKDNVASIRTAERAGLRFERAVVVDGYEARLYALEAVSMPRLKPARPID